MACDKAGVFARQNLKLPATLLVIGALVTGAAQGQGPRLTQAIDSGALIRLHLSSGDRVRGRVLAHFTSDSGQLVFCLYPRTPCRDLTEPAVRRLPAAAIQQIEVARGNHARQGAVIGGVAGALLGYTSATVGNGLCERQCADPGLVTLSGVISGVLWGALIGSTKPVWIAAP